MGRTFGSDIGWAVLDAVADGVEILQNATYRPTALLRYGLANLKTMDIERERQKMARAVCRLKKRGYLERVRKEDGWAFRLTELGERMVRTRQAPPALPEPLTTIVSFDIPERHRDTRQRFREYLKTAGFVRRHDSVWISKLDWSSTLKNETKRLGLSDWVAVTIGELP